MRTAWASLPNAAHIDRVLDDVNRRPGVWLAAESPTGKEEQIIVWNAAWDAARRAARAAKRVDIWLDTWNATRGSVQRGGDHTWYAVGALLAWDDCAALLDIDPDAMRFLVASGHHPAVLLLPACIALKTT